jgi:hypothetical protein
MVLQLDELHELFNLPLSEEAYAQYCDLEIYLQTLQINQEADQWRYIWGDGHYRTTKAYTHLIGSQAVHHAFKWICKSSCQQKHNVFLLTPA